MEGLRFQGGALLLDLRDNGKENGNCMDYRNYMGWISRVHSLEFRVQGLWPRIVYDVGYLKVFLVHIIYRVVPSEHKNMSNCSDFYLIQLVVISAYGMSR